jgi:transcription antitermination factor NusG
MHAEAAWYVVRTKRHKERAAQAALEHHALATYLPLLDLWPRPVVGPAVVAMFPGYVFLHASMPDDFHRVSRTQNVVALVTFAGGPAPLADSVIDTLRQYEAPDGTIRSAPVEPGRPVRIVGGPLRGLAAVIEQRLPARDRVRVLLDLLQRETRVEMPEQWIRRA